MDRIKWALAALSAVACLGLLTGCHGKSVAKLPGQASMAAKPPAPAAGVPKLRNQVMNANGRPAPAGMAPSGVVPVRGEANPADPSDGVRRANLKPTEGDVFPIPEVPGD